jgi:hypothetical protein
MSTGAHPERRRARKCRPSPKRNASRTPPAVTGCVRPRPVPRLTFQKLLSYIDVADPVPSRTQPLAEERMRRTAAFLVLACLAPACRANPAGPVEQRVRLHVHGDSVIFASPAFFRTEDFQVVVVDATSGLPVAGVSVEWQVVAGSASLGAARSTSNSDGVAASWLLQAPVGAYRVRATAPAMDGTAPVIDVRVVEPPRIDAIEPAGIVAGEIVTLTGANFSAVPAENAVSFDFVRGDVLAATPTELRVRVPACLPSRQVSVIAALGGVMSAPRQAQAAGTAGTLLELPPGGVRTFAEPGDLACIRLPGGMVRAAYVLVVHNAAPLLAPPSMFELRALTPKPPLAAAVEPVPEPARSFAHEWEAALRLRERALGPAAGAPDGVAAKLALPAVGTRRDFNVLTRDNEFRKVSAAVRVVSAQAIIYVDVEAESAFTAQDLQYFGGLFDDPIHPTLVDVFGTPSDIDGNQRVIILFTPQVNALTPRGESSFITGFFYGCDLVSRSRCAGTNQGEVFYALVPDPDARWSDARSHAAVRAAVPPVIAHEFQHMIHFARRGFSSDVLWLSEGLAHTAEEIVADVFQDRGDNALAHAFRAGNYSRVQHYLAAPAVTSLIAEEPPGTVALRGAAWLFVKHLRGQRGGHDLLRRLTGSTRSSVANVVHEAGATWQELVTDFGVAMWADGSPDMTGPLDPRYTFVDIDLRTTLSPVPGTFPLRPASREWQDFTATGSVATGSHAYFAVLAPADSSARPLNLVLSGRRGAHLAPASGVRFSVVRVR